MVFVFDTCSVIAGRQEIYRKQNFPSLWIEIEDIINKGEVYIPDAVFDELKALTENRTTNTDTFSWAQGFRTKIQSLHSIDKQQLETETARPTSTYPQLSKKEDADYKVVAAARQLNGTVVTQEQANRSTQTAKTKIPTVCNFENIGCINLSGLIGRYGWIF